MLSTRKRISSWILVFLVFQNQTIAQKNTDHNLPNSLMRQIFISVPYTSGVCELNTEEIPAIGLNKELLCYPTKNRFPPADRAQWFKDGVDIEEDEKYQIVKTFTLFFFISESNQMFYL